MCCYPFHMFVGAWTRSDNWQAWVIINTLGSCSSKPQSTPDFGPWLCKNLVYLGWLKLCTAIDTAQGHYNSVGTSIWDIYQVFCNAMEQWLGSHDPQHHVSTPWLWVWPWKNLIYLGWLKLCGAIAMSQGQYNGVGTFIWDLYQVCCNTREQWLG